MAQPLDKARCLDPRIGDFPRMNVPFHPNALPPSMLFLQARPQSSVREGCGSSSTLVMMARLRRTEKRTYGQGNSLRTSVELSFAPQLDYPVQVPFMLNRNHCLHNFFVSSFLFRMAALCQRGNPSPCLVTSFFELVVKVKPGRERVGCRSLIDL